MQILHLEDTPTDAELIRRVLRREWPDCAISHVATAEEYERELLSKRFDVILSDYSMPGFDGLLALAHAQQSCPSTPFLFLSGMIGEERAVEALKRGATDYIIKDRPARLVPAIRQALAFVEEASRRRRSEDELRASNEQIRLITENIADHITVIDARGTCTYRNRAGLEFYGDQTTQPGSGWSRRIVPQDLPRVIEAFERIAETGAAERFEFRCRMDDGTTRYLEATGAALRNAGGEVGSVVLVSRDVTDRRHAEQRMRDQASLLDKARDAILATDLEHRITYWNASAERLYDVKAADVMGRRLDQIGLGFDPSRFETARAAVLRGGEWRGDFRLQTRSGAAVLVESTWSLVVEQDGRPRAILAIDTDVTERKKLEGQLLRAQRLESVGTLAGGVAHDLNNVLTPILFTIDMLAANVTAPEEKQLVEATRVSVSHGVALVKQMLAFARGGDGERIRLDPAAALAGVEPLIRQNLSTEIELRIRHLQPPLEVYANPTQFNQVLINLALNARDAMPAGGRIDIVTENVRVDGLVAAANPGTEAGDFVRVSVTDTGTGIPPSALDRIFDPFFTTKPPGKGTGLGLSVVAGIMKSHGGFAQVESELGRGTTFALFFPAMPSPATPARRDGATASEGGGAGVLLVDDEPAVRDALRALLQRAGYAIYPAEDARSALREFENSQDRISLVITDMMLPDGSGVDVVRALRAMSPRLPIIAISGMMGSGRYDELLRLNPPVECLAKPLPPTALLSAARRALSPVPLAG